MAVWTWRPNVPLRRTPVADIIALSPAAGVIRTVNRTPTFRGPSGHGTTVSRKWAQRFFPVFNFRDMETAGELDTLIDFVTARLGDMAAFGFVDPQENLSFYDSPTQDVSMISSGLYAVKMTDPPGWETVMASAARKLNNVVAPPFDEVFEVLT